MARRRDMREDAMKKVLVTAAAGLLFSASSLFAGSGDDALYNQGGQLYNGNCRVCHINRAEGDQPTDYSRQFNPPDFANPSFWRGDAEKKITETVRRGKPPMPAFPGLKPDEVKALIYYLSHTFKR